MRAAAIRRGIVLTALCAGGLFVLSSAASAELTDPTNPAGPVSANVPFADTSASPASQEAAPAPVQPQAEPVPADAAITPVTPEPTIAPEPVVLKAAPKKKVVSAEQAPVVESVGQAPEIQPPDSGLPGTVRAFLSEVARACHVAATSGTGGPVLALFAVLGMASVLDPRRVFKARWSLDEQAPEMLYAWDVIAPG